jgi:hypothetical protein
MEFLSQWEQTHANDPLQKWCKAMINNDLEAAIKIEDQINIEAGGTPWDPKYADPEFEIVKAISKL